MSESAFEELKKFFTVNLKCPDEDSRYMIEGIDLSYSFNCFQQHVLDVLPTGKLAFETHIHHILSMSSIMLIFKGDNASSEAYNLIPEAKKTIYAGISSSAQFSRQLLIQALDIIQGVAIDGSINRKVGSLRLLELSSTESSDLGQRILLYLHRAVQTLTKDNSLNPINDEADLCGRFILPLLQTLSDELDSTENVFFKLNNSKNHECGVAPMLNLSERRPDGVIKWLSQSGQKTIGFMETKTISISHQTSKINIDLIRLGLMGKNAIDVYNLKSVLLIQAVGMNLTFYLFQKKTVDDYMMVELDHLAFPQSLVDLPSLIGNMDRVVRLLDIFKRECFIVQPTQNETRPTVRSPLMNQVALSSTSRKRKNDYPHSYC
ncbi:MAG: hypothetical protein EXX96DRAFT_493017 [Benjaminiella poitrasii]|nr:MAG: hypothetical protein EXX96DRAFT_493017 [Benjaminiella poitrasii]